MIKLYTYFRSTASYRVRIALHLKGLPFESIPVDLRKGEQHGAFLKMNPQGLVPYFKEDEFHSGQSLVILDYLESHYPTPSLYPKETTLFWKAKEWAQFIACEMHPLNNLRVLHYLQNVLKGDEQQKQAWYFHWLKEGFDRLESALGTFSTSYALCDYPTILDLCLVPQMYNAYRFGFDLTPYPHLQKIEDNCLKLEAFQKAKPEAQPDGGF